MTARNRFDRRVIVMAGLFAILIYQVVVPFVMILWTSLKTVQPGDAGFLTFALGTLWLLFFPNAPYMLTDFIHLRQSPTTPLWYDGLMISSFAWTALLLGFVSLYLMQPI